MVKFLSMNSNQIYNNVKFYIIIHSIKINEFIISLLYHISQRLALSSGSSSTHDLPHAVIEHRRRMGCSRYCILSCRGTPSLPIT